MSKDANFGPFDLNFTNVFGKLDLIVNENVCESYTSHSSTKIRSATRDLRRPI